MINQQLVNFIRQQLHAGSTKEKITEDLLSGDWNEQDIEEGFEAIIDIPIPKALVSESIINPTLNQNFDQAQNKISTLGSIQSQETSINLITKKEPVFVPSEVAPILKKEIITPQNEIIVSNQLENQTSIPVLNEISDLNIKPTLNFNSNLDLKLKSIPILNSNLSPDSSDSIAAINQKLNPSLHFNSNTIPDLDFSKDSSTVVKNTTNILEKSHNKYYLSKKILIIILIIFLLIAVLISVYYFRDNLKDLSIINYFNK